VGPKRGKTTLIVDAFGVVKLFRRMMKGKTQRFYEPGPYNFKFKLYLIRFKNIGLLAIQDFGMSNQDRFVTIEKEEFDCLISYVKVENRRF